MRNIVLKELASRWIRDASTPEAQDGNKKAELQNAVNKAVRETKRECADTLIMLTQIMGEQNERQ